MTDLNSVANFQSALLRKARWRPLEFVVWAAAFALPLVMPSHSLLVNEIAIVALFAMSLDLILGYTGIVSLGHAAFFGFGAYAAALFAKLVMPDPIVGLLFATVLSALLGMVASVTILRGSDLTRLMVTLGTALLLLELANKLDWLTGGADGLQGVVMGPVLGMLIEHDMDLVFSFADRMTVLVNGTLLTEGDPETIANDPKVKEVYLGHGEAAHV